ncbi:MAG: hypothetical protein ACRC3Y_07485 [Romboutsia sp.]|uniref:hypothetical protein n=1 Tax=Romboutsia sp. TaxID=1965302 RepID=UPI003F408A27
MAYPIVPPSISVSQAVDVIAASEASILQGLNDLFCNDFVTPVLTSTLSNQDKLTTIANVLNIMACKENTVAGVINGLADIIVVNKGLAGPQPQDCNCGCNSK